MASLKKNFSAQLYSDLEKYEANLTGFKDSRLKKQASGVSLPSAPPAAQMVKCHHDKVSPIQISPDFRKPNPNSS